MAKLTFNCEHCGNEAQKEVGHYNRAKKLGLGVYCNRTCAGLARRSTKPIEQKKKDKSEYDKIYRAKNLEKKKAKAKEYHKRTYTLEKGRKFRNSENRKRYQKAYINSEKYREWKKNYDQKHLANKKYGEFAEAAIILRKLENELDSKEIKYALGITQNKSSQKRKRKWKN